MFVLDELDDLLKSLVPQAYRKSPQSGRSKLKVSLKDIERINVDALQLASRTPYLAARQERNLLASGHPLSLRGAAKTPAINKSLAPSTDSLFLEAASRLILRPMSRVADRHYPWAKLIVCEGPGYDILLKVGQLLTNSNGTNFIYKPPFKATAVLLLDDIVQLMGQLGGQPIVSSLDRSSGKQLLSFNYSLIRRVFPCIKMSDIILLLSRRLLEVSSWSPASGLAGQEKASTAHILQFLAHYARTVQVVELDPLYRELGKPHLIYDNVLLMPCEDTAAPPPQQPTQRMSLEQLSRLAGRLVQVAARLGLALESVTYRAGDLSRQSRVFCELLAAASKKTAAGTMPEHGQASTRPPARVLVIDRAHDLVGALLHADLYGPFLDQEMDHQHQHHHQKPPQAPVDELDQRLHLCRLTEVLGEVLRYSMELKSSAAASRSAAHRNSAIQSVRRHLNRIELIYRRLNEGYLLLLRLELSLTAVGQQLRQLLAGNKSPGQQLSELQHEQLADKLERILEAFNRLVELAQSSSSVRAGDLIRVACVMLDVCNLYLHHQQATAQLAPSAPPSTKASAQRCQLTLASVRLHLLNGPTRTRGELAGGRRALEAFDQLSRESCGAQRCTLSPVELVESFANEQLDAGSFPTIRLAGGEQPTQAGAAGCRTIVTFLGQLSALELARIKALEARLRSTPGRQAATGDMYILLAGSLVRPEQLLETLQ